jgi:hypothetical protein
MALAAPKVKSKNYKKIFLGRRPYNFEINFSVILSVSDQLK